MLWTAVLEKTLESPLDCKEIQPVNLKGNRSWIFIGRTDAEAEAPMLWPFDVKGQLTRKGPDAGKDWRQEEKGTTEDEVVWWHHPLDGHEFEQALGVDDGHGSLACCSPRGHKVSDTTDWLNWTDAGRKYMSTKKCVLNQTFYRKWMNYGEYIFRLTKTQSLLTTNLSLNTKYIL